MSFDLLLDLLIFVVLVAWLASRYLRRHREEDFFRRSDQSIESSGEESSSLATRSPRGSGAWRGGGEEAEGQWREIFKKAFLQARTNDFPKSVQRRVENLKIHETRVLDSWRELRVERFSVLFVGTSLDWTVDRATGRLVSGDPIHPTEFRELWGFERLLDPDPTQGESSSWRVFSTGLTARKAKSRETPAPRRVG